jgi:hypothetical protein
MKLRWVVAVAVVVFAFATTGLAGTVGGGAPIFEVITNSSVPSSSMVSNPSLTANGDGTYSTASNHQVLNAYTILFEFTLDPDPAISGTISLTSLSTETQTFSISATMSNLLSIPGGTSVTGSFGETRYDDANQDGALGLGSVDLDPFYIGAIDGGDVAGIGSFTFFEVTGLPPGQVGTFDPLSLDPTAGPALSSSIGIQFPGIILTAGDRVRVPFEFVVVPESSGLALFAITLALILLRFARERASVG